MSFLMPDSMPETRPDSVLDSVSDSMLLSIPKWYAKYPVNGMQLDGLSVSRVPC